MSPGDNWELVAVEKRGGSFFAYIGEAQAVHHNSATLAARKAAAAHLGCQQHEVEIDILSAGNVMARRRQPARATAWDLLWLSVGFTGLLILLALWVKLGGVS